MDISARLLSFPTSLVKLFSANHIEQFRSNAKVFYAVHPDGHVGTARFELQRRNQPLLGVKKIKYEVHPFGNLKIYTKRAFYLIRILINKMPFLK